MAPVSQMVIVSVRVLDCGHSTVGVDCKEVGFLEVWEADWYYLVRNIELL